MVINDFLVLLDIVPYKFTLFWLVSDGKMIKIDVELVFNFGFSNKVLCIVI